jgi:hypothetical protein
MLLEKWLQIISSSGRYYDIGDNRNIIPDKKKVGDTDG